MARVLVVALMPVLGVFSRAQNPKTEPHPEATIIARGQIIYKQNCSACHYSNKSEKKIGPSLLGLFKKKELAGSHKPMNEANIRELIRNGSSGEGTMPMPSFADNLSKSELDSLVAYLKTL